MPLLTTKMYYTEKTSKVPGWPKGRTGARPSHWNTEDYPDYYYRPFFEILSNEESNFHTCTVEQAEAIPEIHHDGVHVKILNSKITDLWQEIDEYLSNDAHYELWTTVDSMAPIWDEASRMWYVHFYHRVREN